MNPIYEDLNDTSDENYNDDYTDDYYQYDTSETDNINELYATSYYKEDSDTQGVNDSVMLYDKSSTVTANFLSDSTTIGNFYSSTSNSILSQSETVISTTAMDKIEGTFYSLYLYINTVI